MKVSNTDSVAVYTVAGSSSKQLPEWLSQQRKRTLKNDPEWANRVTLLQDFEFEEASNCVAVSPDQEWVISTGTYKPQIHVHNLEQLSLSWSRHTTSLCRALVILSEDYSKSLYLQEDRSIELHTPAGLHLALRIPRYGRDLVYDSFATEALVPSVGLGADGTGEVFRLNMELGRFMQSYSVDVGSDELVERGLQGSVDVGGVNTAAIAGDTHGLIAFGTSLGTTEFFDPRTKTKVATLQAHDGEISALNFGPTGLSLATGSSNGTIQLYDLRRPRPLLTKDQGFGLPVKKLIHMTTSSHEKKLLSMDRKIIKIWEEGSGDLWVNIQATQDLNDVAWVRDTGMLLTANEGPQQHAFHVPQLGPAPKFCTFLDNMVEEMAEEVSTETYSNFKFLTIAELRSLSLDHLVGKTNLLRPYMHGYFVASKLYDQARLIANPYVWEEERAKRVQEKIEKERSSRIRGTKKVKVNQKFVDKLQKQENRKKGDTELDLEDERWKAIMEDAEFAIDENSREFRGLNPSTVVEGQDETMANSGAAVDARDDSSDEEEQSVRKRSDKVVMRVSSSAQRGSRARDTALGSRTHKQARIDKIQPGGAAGEKSVTFIPESSKKKQPEAPAPTKRNDNRRSASANTFRKM